MSTKDRFLSLEGSARSLSMIPVEAGSMAGVMDWVDDRFGPIRYIHGTAYGEPGARWWIYSSKLSRPIGDFFIESDLQASGTSISPSEALIRALGESVERYNGLNSIKYSGFTSEPGDASDNQLIKRFARCADFEKCHQDLKQMPKSKLTLSRVKILSTDEDALIPAVCVHLNFQPVELEPHFTHSITTGLSFYPTLFGAIWSGLKECVERDAIMLTWWNRLPASRILIGRDNGNAALTERMRRVRQAGLEAYFFNISSDFRIPTVLCLLQGSTAPYWTAGASCHEEAFAACSKALDEAMSIRLTSSDDFLKREVPSFASFDWIKKLSDRILLYAKWKDCPTLDFLLQNENTLTIEEFQQQSWWQAPANMAELKELAAKMKELDLTTLWSDTTIDDVKELGYCVKVIVPEMMPLSVVHNASFLATARLAKAAGRQRLHKSDINPFPHPFA